MIEIMTALEQIKKTRAYLDYLEEHIRNVERAFREIEIKCKDMRFIRDDLFYHTLRSAVEGHDISKLSEREFVQYRQWFYPVDGQEKNRSMFDEAWKHHWCNNSHHWEHWTAKIGCTIHPDDWEVDCAHMVIDWMAMGYKFGDTAKEFYEKGKDRSGIKLEQHHVDFLYDIFSRLYPTT